MCEHKNFYTEAKITRIQESKDSKKIIAYRLDVNVFCVDCKQPFKFIGLPEGFLNVKPTMAVGGLIARLPIEPTDK